MRIEHRNITGEWLLDIEIGTLQRWGYQTRFEILYTSSLDGGSAYRLYYWIPICPEQFDWV